MKFPTSSILAGLALAWCGAAAAVSADEAAQLGKTLTPVGGEMAGNKDGTIPAYAGGLKTPPPDYKKGSGQLADPFASDKPKFAITKANMAQYGDRLSAGARALLERHASFRMDVYPTHRSVAFPQYVIDNTAACATSAKVTNNGLGMEGCVAGYPFPIPKSGFEAMWNHLVRFSGRAYESRYENYNVNAGHATMSVAATVKEDFPYWDASKKGGDIFFRLKLAYSGPARRAGEQIMAMDPLNFVGQSRRAWQYLPGQRRVKLAPDISFDTPNPGTAGASTYDDAFIFNGSMERYDFKLVGKQELYVPYNAYKYAYGPGQDKIFTADHINPDVVRWELHRVWVVEANLAPGKRHIYSKRRFYLDEDSWAALASDQYDARGQLYRAAFAFETPRYDVPSPWSDALVQYDLISGIYATIGWMGDNGGLRETEPLPDREWTADALAGAGIR